MFNNINFARASIFLLLFLHVVWVANHLRLVAKDAIDPWKLGGYGMYTGPAPSQTMFVFEVSPRQQIRRIPNRTIKQRSYVLATFWTNRGRVFRCTHIPASALIGLFGDNERLVGRRLILIYAENEFKHQPPSVDRVKRGEVNIEWQDDRRFTYVSNFCGDTQIFTAELP